MVFNISLIVLETAKNVSPHVVIVIVILLLALVIFVIAIIFIKKKNIFAKREDVNNDPDDVYTHIDTNGVSLYY